MGNGATQTGAPAVRGGGGGKTRKGVRKQWGSKQVLASPFVLTLPGADDATDAKVSALLREHLAHGMLKREARPARVRGGDAGGRARARKVGDADADAGVGVDGGAAMESGAGRKGAKSGNKSGNARKPRGLLVGVNEVTRALERARCAVVVVCRDVVPNVLVAHLPALCCVGGARLVSVSGGGGLLGDALGARSVLAVGVARDGADAAVQRLGGRLGELGKAVTASWLTCDGVGRMPEPVVMRHRGKRERDAGLNLVAGAAEDDGGAADQSRPSKRARLGGGKGKKISAGKSQ